MTNPPEPWVHKNNSIKLSRRILGSTDLSVSVLGLGCGGHSRLGYMTIPQSSSIDLIRKAYNMGVNYFDTAETYRTETLLKKAFDGIAREKYIISSKSDLTRPWKQYQNKKFHLSKKNYWINKMSSLTPEKIILQVEDRLKSLGTSYLDIFFVHGPSLTQYISTREIIIPTLELLRDQGKIRFFGLTEDYKNDRNHQMLNKALDDQLWSVMMVGYNLLNPMEGDLFIRKAKKNDVGIIIMSAINGYLISMNSLIKELKSLYHLDQERDNIQKITELLKWSLNVNNISSLSELAYRFCKDTKGVDTVLSSTGNINNLSTNIKTFNKSKLSKKFIAEYKNRLTNILCNKQ